MFSVKLLTEMSVVDISLGEERRDCSFYGGRGGCCGRGCQLMTATLPANMKLKCGIKFKLKNFFSSNQFDPNFSKSVEGGGKRQSDKNPVLTSFSCLDTPVLDRKER